jgi:hypothetical protein
LILGALDMRISLYDVVVYLFYYQLGRFPVQIGYFDELIAFKWGVIDGVMPSSELIDESYVGGM